MGLRIEIEMTVRIIGRPVTQEIVLAKIVERRDVRTEDSNTETAVSATKSLSTAIGSEVGERLRTLMTE